MGNVFANLFKSSFSKSQVKIIMFGLEHSGKTTILYHMKLGQEVETSPTIGFNAETITYENMSFTVWDVNGADRNHALWRHYCVGARTLIFVVDSCNRENIEKIHFELWEMVGYHDLTFKEILVYATKQDIPNAMTVHVITEKLELDVKRLPRNIKWYVQECSGKTGSGLLDGLSWIARQISKSP